MAIMSPIDDKGLPFIKHDDDGSWMIEAVPFNWPREDGKIHVWLCDEVTRSTPAVLNAMLGFTDSRQLGGYRAPKKSVFIFTGNHTSDKGYTLELDEAFRSRYSILFLEQTWQEWCERFLAEEEGESCIAAFHRYHRGDWFFDGDPANDEFQRCRARTWSRVSELLKQGLPNEFQEKAIISYVGTRAASAFKLFCTEIWGQLPDGDEILANPETALCPVDDLGKLAILATSVGRAVTPELMNNLVKYINRMPDEFAMIAITDAARLNPENKKTAAFTTWQAEHSDLLHN
tara:strand:+ start:763 stop:1629 length:867 start_codon:yes stop_codon:yes gene_type:complete